MQALSRGGGAARASRPAAREGGCKSGGVVVDSPACNDTSKFPGGIRAISPRRAAGRGFPSVATFASRASTGPRPSTTPRCAPISTAGCAASRPRAATASGSGPGTARSKSCRRSRASTTRRRSGRSSASSACARRSASGSKSRWRVSAASFPPARRKARTFSTARSTRRLPPTCAPSSLRTTVSASSWARPNASGGSASAIRRRCIAGSRGTKSTRSGRPTNTSPGATASWPRSSGSSRGN